MNLPQGILNVLINYDASLKLTEDINYEGNLAWKGIFTFDNKFTGEIDLIQIAKWLKAIEPQIKMNDTNQLEIHFELPCKPEK